MSSGEVRWRAEVSSIHVMVKWRLFLAILSWVCAVVIAVLGVRTYDMNALL